MSAGLRLTLRAMSGSHRRLPTWITALVGVTSILVFAGERALIEAHRADIAVLVAMVWLTAAGMVLRRVAQAWWMERVTWFAMWSATWPLAYSWCGAIEKDWLRITAAVFLMFVLQALAGRMLNFPPDADDASPSR